MQLKNKVILISIFLIVLAVFYASLYNYNYTESKELISIAEKEYDKR